MLPALMEPAPAAPRSFPPAQAGAFLIVVTAIVMAAGTLVGWAAGSVKNGLIAGAILGVPAGIVAVYFRYRGYFS
jgi:hypothetical protein